MLLLMMRDAELHFLTLAKLGFSSCKKYFLYNKSGWHSDTTNSRPALKETFNFKKR